MNTYNMKFHAWFSGVMGLLLVVFIASCDDSDLIRRVEPTLEIQDELLMGPVASRLYSGRNRREPGDGIARRLD